MTLVFHQDVPGPGMHALVIGVAGYPHCGAAAPEGSLPAGIPDVSTAEVTALEMAGWLVETQRKDAVLPLASLEVLVSSAAGGPAPVLEVDGQSKKVEGAAFDPVCEAIIRWRDRCQDPSATALFYFAGHGLARWRGDEALLLADFGRLPDAPFQKALDTHRLVDGMGYCQARTQLFFFDCCREIREEALQLDRLNAQVVLTPGRNDWLRRTSLLTLHATALGGSAFGRRRQPTRFSRELRAAFDGLASEQGEDGVWRIQAGKLLGAVQSVRDRTTLPGDERDHLPTSGLVEAPTQLPIRELDGPPLVPFSIRCDPAEAARAAELLLTDRASGASVGPGRPGSPWQGETRAGIYDLTARFPHGGWRDVSEKNRWLLPPRYSRRMPLERS
ncbi:hypothetical protein [Streptomyces sp. NPDC046887]|uniref:hypothetical protein n=1 Tax=Streptomyces sp. NPDC046887 TaxID=3155472 RepID=UPI0033DA1029